MASLQLTKALSQTEHRHYPLPEGPWVLRMRWHALLFMHWPVTVDLLRPLIPPALELETFDGSAWLGVVPFRMEDVRPRFLPGVPWLSNFPELNLRTYVTHGGKPGLWFFSLDAHNPVAVRLARATFGLPYFDAKISCEMNEEEVRFKSVRTHKGPPPPHPGGGPSRARNLRAALLRREDILRNERRRGALQERAHPQGRAVRQVRGALPSCGRAVRLTSRNVGELPHRALLSLQRGGKSRETRAARRHPPRSLAPPESRGRGRRARDHHADRGRAAGDGAHLALCAPPRRRRLAAKAHRLVNHRELLQDARFLLVTDPRSDLAARVAAAVGGGVDVVQLRDKRASREELLPLGGGLKEICERGGAPSRGTAD